MTEIKAKKLNIESSSETKDSVTMRYPRTNNVEINLSDLMLELEDYQNALKNAPNVTLILVILSLWVPVVTSDFKNIYYWNGHDIKIVYSTFVFIFTLYLILPIFLWVYRLMLIQYFKIRNIVPRKNLYKYETNPRKKAENIINTSSEKTKR